MFISFSFHIAARASEFKGKLLANILSFLRRTCLQFSSFRNFIFLFSALSFSVKKITLTNTSQKQMEEDDNSERSFLKRSAFNQYFAISQDMASFEKELFAKFSGEGTFVVNNMLKRNILKLKFMTMPEELRDEIMRKEAPQSMALSRIQKSARSNKQLPKTRQSAGLLGALTPRKSISTKSKFNIYSTAIQWMTSRHGSDNPDLVLAEKLMKSSESTASLKTTTKSLREARTDFKMSQAKCKIY